MNCCDRPNKCQRGRDCPIRIERIREAKRLLDQDQPSVPALLLGRLALGAAILAAVLVSSTCAQAVRVVA